MEKVLQDNKSYIKIIYVISALIPIAVAFLILFPAKLALAGDWVKALPAVHALVNSITVIFLVLALFAIKSKNIELHKKLMFGALCMGVLFLVSYIIYHSSVDSVKFGDVNHDGIVSDLEKTNTGTIRLVYLALLASHIILSISVVPFVLLAFYYALTGNVKRHTKIVKFTFPIWMYVSVTGVIVYFLIKPYYL